MRINKTTLKQHAVHVVPYILFAFVSTKLSRAWRTSSGSDLSAHIMSFLSMLGTAFQSPWPSIMVP